MKTKVTLILLLLLFAMGGNAFAQVSINTTGMSYQPAILEQGGVAGTYKVDIKNNNATALSGTFSLALPTGMEYVAGSITGTGVTQLNISNLQAPTFTVSNIPSGNTLQLTFSARINCGYSAALINYGMTSAGNTVTGTSPVAGNTPAPAYVFSSVPNPQALSTPLNTNAVRTIKFKNTGNVAVSTVIIESSVVTAAQYQYYKVLNADNGTITTIPSGYRITLTGAALQSAVTTAVGAANTSFDPNEEITLVLTEQMTSCILGSTIELKMKVGSTDTKNSFCFFDTSTASITTPVGNPAISLTRIAGTTWPDFCNNGKASYVITNTGSSTSGLASALYNIKLPWSMNYTNAGLTPAVNDPGHIQIKKVFINGNDVTSLILTRNGTGSGALIPGLGNGFVLNFAALTSAFGSSLQSLDGDGKFDDLAAGDSLRLDFEYGFDTSTYQTCQLNSGNLPNTGDLYFNLGTSFADQCGTRTNRINYSYGIMSDLNFQTFAVGGQSYRGFSASLSVAALYPGDKTILTTNFAGSLSSAFTQAGKVLKTFTIVLPDGLDYDSTGIVRYYNSATIPTSVINYNPATKTLVITPTSNQSQINQSVDILDIPLVASGGVTVSNKNMQYSSTFGFVGCGVAMPYGCNTAVLNYAIITDNCPTVGTTAFDMTRATFGYVPSGSTNVFYQPTAFVNENTPGINLHGAVGKDKVKTSIKGIVNSTSFAELWARVKYKSNAATLNLSNFDPLSATTSDVAGVIKVIKASDGSTLSTNITVSDIVFSYDSGTSLQVQQVNLGTKIGIGKAINYNLTVGDKIEVNWFTRVSRNNLSYTYSQLSNLEGDLYTKDAGGLASNCEAIPVGFFIQRLNLAANSFSGIQNIAGTNSLRVGNSIINGNHSDDIPGDHFPNEVRSYANFRTTQATIPGIWTMDTTVGKEPYFIVSNVASASSYKIDRSLFNVTYSGGNTIVTFNNDALGSNGMPLSTANIPVIADWVGVNGNASMSFYMLPVCVSTGNITVTVRQAYDLYTTESDNSNVEYGPNVYTQGGTSTNYYSYSANAAPTLQNVDGIGSTVNWQVRVSNTSDTATIVAAGGGANLPNNWISFVSPNNNITVTKLTDIVTGTVYPAVSYDTGKYWVKLGDIATTATYNVEATYTTCVDDKIQATHGFGAIGYPVDPQQGYGAELGTCSNSETKFNLNLAPKDISFDMTVVSPQNPVQFCTNPISGSEHMIDYSITVKNTGVGNAENLIMEAAFPANYTARAGTSKLTFDGTTKSIGDPVFNTTKGVWQWYISADANGIPFLPPASTGKNIMVLAYQGEASCGFVSGGSVSYNMRATSGCGQVKEKSASGSGMELSMVPSSMNTYFLTPTMVALKNDGSGAAYSIQIKNQGTNPISSNESVYVTIPSSIDYVAGSVVPVLGAGNITAPLTNTVVGNTRILTFAFPTGAGGGGLVQNETAIFNIQFKIVNPAALSCGTITDAVKLESVYTVTGVTCGATACPVNFITGNAKTDASITKTNLVITPGTSSATFASTTNNDVTVKYTVGNTGTIANSTPIVVDFFNDLNKDGLYTTGEPILYTQTITGAAANLAAGTTSAEQTTAVFSIPETGMCAITAAIRLVNNTQVCADSATLIPLKYASAQTAFTVCGKSDVTIGNAPNGATVSWSPATYLSDAAISNPVFNYTGTPVTAVTDFVYTATVTHPGGCTNTFTNTITVNPDPVVTITDPAAVCTGASVDLSAAAVTTGSAANLKYTYFTDVDATAALVNYTAVTTAGTYYIKGTNTNGCFTVKPVVVKVNPLPTASIGATGAVCKGDATAPVVTFTGANGTAPYTFTYNINNGSNLTVTTVSGNSVNVPASTAAAGSFVYTLVSVKDSSTSACTQTQTGTATVTINPLPTAAIAGTTSVCKDDTAPNVTFTGAGGTAPYTFTYKVNGGTDETVTTTSGNAVTVAAPTDTAGSFVYTLVSVKDASTTACTQAQTGTATITVKALPTATIAGTAAVCKDAAAPNVTFTGAGGTAPYTFTYKLNNGADQTVTTTTGSSVTVAQPTGTAGSFVYTLVSVKDGSTSACTQVQTGTATITVNPLPTATIAGTTAVCKDGTAPTVTLTGAGGTSPYTFTYKVNGGADQTVTTTGGSVAMLTAPTAAAGSFVYTLVSVKDASTSACTQAQTGTATITVNPLPTAAIAGTTAVCKDAAAPNVTFTGAGGTAPYTFTYKLNSGADQTVTTTTGNSVTVAQPTGTAGSFVYTLVSVKDGSTSACTQAQAGTATITVNPLPTAAIAGTTAVCKDAAAPNVTFTGAGGIAPYTFTYKVNGGADQTVTTTSGDAVTVAQATAAAGSFVYTLVSVKDASSTACTQAQTGTTTITVNPLPTAAITGTTAVCKDAAAPNVTFTGAGGTAPYTFTYKLNNGADQTITTTSGDAVTVAQATAATGSFVYTLVSVKDASSTACTQAQTGTATITVNPLPTAAIAGTTVVCKDTAAPTVTFTGAGGTAPYTFTYKVNGGADQTVTTTSGDAVTVAQATGTVGDFVYTLVSVKDASSTACVQTQTGTATVTVNALLALNGTASTTCAADGSGYVLNFTVTGQAPYTVTGTGAPGTWSGNDWTSSPITAGTNYNVSVTDAYACNTVVVADTAPICCVYEVTAPTFPAATITCYDQMPTAVSLTKAEFEALGNGDGSIGNIPCGVIEITASNGAEPSCNGNVIRTYTVTEYADPNGNKVRDLGEDTVLNTTVITQTFTLQRADFVMPADQAATVACISAVTAPVVPVVKDNCGNILTASAPVISTVPACNGVETYTYTFTDCAGHTHDWVYTYTIDNTVAPTGTAPADVTVQCIGDIPAANVNGILNVKGNCNNTVSVTVAETNNGGSGCKASPYIVTRTYTLTDCGGLQTQLVQTLTAVDTTAPVFAGTLPANITVECSAAIPAPVTLTATDNCSAATVSYVEVKVNGSCSGNYQLQRTWTASDACGNETKHTQVIQVVDTTAPVFVEALPAATINASCDTIPEAETLTATDACSNAFVTYTETKTAGDCSARYTLTRTWTASDECGNENIFTQTINVACLPNIFNGISPNGDGINDKFVIDGIDCFPNNTLQIFNRYGVRVYEKKGYDNVTNPFEGFSDGRATVIRGDKLPTGTYFYTLEYDDSGKQVQRSGYLYISNQ